jgi:hypothetical protein
VIEEADEAHYWLQHLAATHISVGDDIESLTQEATELVAIFTRAHKTAKDNLEAKRRRQKRRTAAHRQE